MTKIKLFVYVTISCILFYGTPHLCCAANAMLTSRFTLAVNGTPSADLSMDIISVSYEEIFGTMEITVNNWGTGGYKYSDGNLLSLGTPVALSTGSSNNLQKMFEGRITALAPKFPANEAPLLTFTVSGLKPQYPPSRNSQIELVLHQALLEFYPVLKQKERVDVIECTGVTVGTPNLRVYTLLTISGVGQRFSGVYSVTETIHRFDSSRGYTTRFTASKILRPLGRIP